jgi:hypothetical protein
VQLPADVQATQGSDVAHDLAVPFSLTTRRGRWNPRGGRLG